MPSLSIVIPTLNEAGWLGWTLRYFRLLEPSPAEIIVVDGGSQDETVTIARNYGISVIVCPQAGRAIQMNQGAKTATGELLCFLHADTLYFERLINGLLQKRLKSITDNAFRYF